MSRIISVFSNVSGDLASLKEEFGSLFRFFNKAEIKKKVDFEPYLNDSVDEITSHVLKAQSDLSIFQFSGHSSNAGLDLIGADFNQDHLVNFFSTLNENSKSLECVILNGCENHEIVNKLGSVPVVIGSKTEIQDKVAEKFTQDFFSSLIAGGKTYQQAFKEAVAAQTGIKHSVIDETTRSSGSFSALTSKSLDEYFMVVNDSKIANRSITLKKKPFNWVRFISLLGVIVVTGLIALFWTQIIDSFKGYSCPDWADDSKCRIFVADFLTDMNSIEGKQINDILAEGLEQNQQVNKYIESKSGDDFDDLIKGNGKVTEKNIHQVCDFDISMTGNILKASADQYKMDIIVYSELSEFDEDFKDDVEIGNLVDLSDMVQNVGSKNSSDFILNRFCIACAEKQPELIAIVENNLIKYKENLSSAESYQNLNVELFKQYKAKKDTANMIVRLEEIASVGKNDYVLGALDRKGKLLASSGREEEAVASQSKYLEEVENRIEYPKAYENKSTTTKYEKNRMRVLNDRTQIILKDTVKYKQYLPEVVKNVTELQETNYRNKAYGNFLNGRKSTTRPRDRTTFSTDTFRDAIAPRPTFIPYVRPRIIDTSIININANPSGQAGSTDTSNVNPPILYDVALVTYGTTKEEHYKLAKSLQRMSYKLSKQSKGGQYYVKEDYIKPYVEYNHPKLKKTARVLAKYISKSTGKKFSARVSKNLDLDTEKSTIYIYWYNKQRPDQEFEQFEGIPRN